MDATIREAVRRLPFDDKLELLEILHAQVDETLNQQQPLPIEVVEDLKKQLERMRDAPHPRIPWRDVLNNK
jgi:hypothetical protein